MIALPHNAFQAVLHKCAGAADTRADLVEEGHIGVELPVLESRKHVFRVAEQP